MARSKDPNISSDRKRWNVIFNGMVGMVQKQQSELQFVEKRFKLQHERWISNVNLLKQQRSQLRRTIENQEMERAVESTKAELFMSIKQKESLLHKLYVESTQGDLADLKEWSDLLTSKCADPKEPLEEEVKRLKHENEKLNSKKTSEVSALLAERDFVWNQYNMLESQLTDKLNNKQAEVEEANEKIRNLLTSMEQLQASNTEKDNLITNLKFNMAKLEADSLSKTKEIARLSKELESVKKSRSDPVTPELRRCTSEGPELRRRTSEGRVQLGGKNSIAQNKNVTVKKELNSDQVVKQGSRNSKRKTAASSSTLRPPSLMPSTFKAPKLKSSSPHVT